MTIIFTNGSDGLFDVLGVVFHAQATINTARGTTVPAEIVDVHDILESSAFGEDIDALFPIIADTPQAARQQFAATMSSLSQFAARFLVETVHLDSPLPRKNIASALAELIAQMEDNAQSVDASAVSAIAAAGGGNAGDGVVIVTAKRGDGLAQELALAEAIEAVSASGSLRLTGQPDEAAAALAANWPSGSALSATLQVIDPARSLIVDGDFEEESDASSDLPLGWLLAVGTPGTTVRLTTVEVQTLTVSGTPTSGFYYWQILHDGVTKTTGALAFNAGGAELQAAIRELGGFEDVLVETSGTAPDFVHEITFNGVGGDLALHSVIEHTDNGVFTPAETTAGTAAVYTGGRALWLTGDGAELTSLGYQLRNLQPETAYAVSLWGASDGAIVAGVVTIDLADGLSGTVLQDAQGNNSSLTFNAADLTAAFQHLDDLTAVECVFRTPEVLPSVVYLRIRVTTAITSGEDVFLDRLALSAMTELYPGGPLAAAFSGADAFEDGDEFTITVANDRAGAIQEWFDRNFSMRAQRLLLPSDSAGAETIADSLIG